MKIFVKTTTFTSVDQDLARLVYKFDKRIYGFTTIHPDNEIFKKYRAKNLITHNPNTDAEHLIFWVHTKSLDRLTTITRIFYEI